MKKVSTGLFSFFLVSTITLFLLISSVFAQKDISTFSSNFLIELNKEVATSNNFIDEFNKADLNNRYELRDFTNELIKDQKIFQDSLSYFKRQSTTDLPKDLSDALQDSITASEYFVQGTNEINSAISNQDNNKLDQGQKTMNRGVDTLNDATSKYNSFADSYNNTVQASNTTSSNSSFSTQASDPGLFSDSIFTETLTFGKPLLYIYLYLLIVGYVLTSKYRSKISKLVTGKIKPKNFKNTSLYGLHLLILFPYLYIILCYSVLLLIDFAYIAIVIILSAQRIPLALVIAIFVVLVTSFWGILKGFFGSKNKNVFGVSISKKEQPGIWKLCWEVSRDVGTNNVDEIFISPDAGIGVHLTGGLFSMLIGRTKRILTIGMPSITSLTVSQMKSILAHEFGHFSNKDTSWNSLTFTMGSALDNTLKEIPKPWDNLGSAYIKLVSAINPALWVLLAYRLLFLIVTNGFSRLREVFADKKAIELYGYKNFTNGLMRVARNDYIFSSVFKEEAIKMFLENESVYTNVFEVMKTANESIKREEMLEINKKIFASDTPSKYDTHPLLKDRLNYSKYFEVNEKYPTNNKPFSIYFIDWETVSKQMSDIFSFYIGTLVGYDFNKPSDRSENVASSDDHGK